MLENETNFFFKKSQEKIIFNHKREITELIRPINYTWKNLYKMMNMIKTLWRMNKFDINFTLNSQELHKIIYTKETWYIVRNTPGVTGFVGPDPMNPTPLTPEEVRALNVDIDDISDEIYIDAFKIGDRIAIISGPLAGNEGTVEAVLKDKKCIKAMVSMFGRKLPAELEYTQVEKIDD